MANQAESTTERLEGEIDDFGTVPPPLELTYDPHKDVLTVEGSHFSGAFFRTLAEPEDDMLYRICKRRGVVTIQVLGRLTENTVWKLNS